MAVASSRLPSPTSSSGVMARALDALDIVNAEVLAGSGFLPTARQDEVALIRRGPGGLRPWRG